ncbi:hypothetical protein CQA66_02015 [Helicobacter aurati]|uniref:Lipid/polyisoprenoid-binding YceI-like domain-containing protein n=1 Tax=Helicobacter aurati TaxID=137778 RepID=A0A3D8J861_9HELI|nr:YceI family protein [Helicobacter aurati]RDU73460.1 hypothetical protein CQA66_02015 [Helicobacter aurati]
MRRFYQYILLLIFAFGQLAFAKQNTNNDNEYIIDRLHSSVSFGIKHLSVADTIGVFEEFEGMLVFEQGEIRKLQGKVLIKSINTFNTARDLDLQDSKFFSQDIALLESLSFQKNTLRARLTINNITREIVFTAHITGPIRNPNLDRSNTASQNILHNPLLNKSSNQATQFQKKQDVASTNRVAQFDSAINNPLTHPMMRVSNDSDCNCYVSYGDNVLGIELFGTINRFDFHIADDTPKELLGDTVWIKIILEASR